MVTKILDLALVGLSIMVISFSFSIGPALNLATKYCDFYIGPFIVNNYRSPGVNHVLLVARLYIYVFFRLVTFILQ
jgi:hypothetical protein